MEVGTTANTLSIEPILHLWNGHKLCLIMKFVICYSCSEALFAWKMWKNEKTRTKKCQKLRECMRKEVAFQHSHKKTCTYQQNSCESVIFLCVYPTGIQFYRKKWQKIARCDQKCLNESSVKRTERVNIRVVGNILRCTHRTETMSYASRKILS